MSQIDDQIDAAISRHLSPPDDMDAQIERSIDAAINRSIPRTPGEQPLSAMARAKRRNAPPIGSAAWQVQNASAALPAPEHTENDDPATVDSIAFQPSRPAFGDPAFQYQQPERTFAQNLGAGITQSISSNPITGRLAEDIPAVAAWQQRTQQDARINPAGGVGGFIGGTAAGIASPTPENLMYLAAGGGLGSGATKLAGSVLGRIEAVAGPQIAQMAEHAIGGAGTGFTISGLREASKITDREWAEDPWGSLARVGKAAAAGAAEFGVAGAVHGGIARPARGVSPMPAPATTPPVAPRPDVATPEGFMGRTGEPLPGQWADAGDASPDLARLMQQGREVAPTPPVDTGTPAQQLEQSLRAPFAKEDAALTDAQFYQQEEATQAPPAETPEPAAPPPRWIGRGAPPARTFPTETHSETMGRLVGPDTSPPPPVDTTLARMSNPQTLKDFLRGPEKPTDRPQTEQEFYRQLAMEQARLGTSRAPVPPAPEPLPDVAEMGRDQLRLELAARKQPTTGTLTTMRDRLEAARASQEPARAPQEPDAPAVAPQEAQGQAGEAEPARAVPGDVAQETGQVLTEPSPKMSDWVRDALISQGKNPDRLLNEIDAARPATKRLLAEDKLTKFYDRTGNTRMADRMRSGDLSAAEYRAGLEEMKKEPPPSAGTSSPGASITPAPAATGAGASLIERIRSGDGGKYAGIDELGNVKVPNDAMRRFAREASTEDVQAAFDWSQKEGQTRHIKRWMGEAMNDVLAERKSQGLAAVAETTQKQPSSRVETAPGSPDLSTMGIDDLRRTADIWGVPRTGGKTALVKRIEAARAASPGPEPKAKAPAAVEPPKPVRTRTFNRPTQKEPPKPFTKGDIEQRILDAHGSVSGEDADNAARIDETGLSAGDYTFYKKLPGEIRSYLQGRPEMKRVFTTTDDATKAGGEDAMGSMGADRYFRIAEQQQGRGRNVDAAKDVLRNSPDPEHQFIVALHDNLPAGRPPTKQIMDGESIPTGSTFEINGEKFEVMDEGDGYRVLKDGEDYPVLPADQVGKIPVDKGTLEGPKAAKTKPPEKGIILWGRRDGGDWLKLGDNTSNAEMGRRQKEGWEVVRQPRGSHPNNITKTDPNNPDGYEDRGGEGDGPPPPPSGGFDLLGRPIADPVAGTQRDMIFDTERKAGRDVHAREGIDATIAEKHKASEANTGSMFADPKDDPLYDPEFDAPKGGIGTREPPEDTGPEGAMGAAARKELDPNAKRPFFRKVVDAIREKVSPEADTRTSKEKREAFTRTLAGHSLPRISAANEDAANEGVRWASAHVAGPAEARAVAPEVLGEKFRDSKFDMKAGAMVVEDRLRGIREAFQEIADNAKTPEEAADFQEKADAVKSLVGASNSPFRTEAEYQAMWRDKELAEVVKRYKSMVQEKAGEVHAELEGQMAREGPKGTFANLIPMTFEELAKAPKEVKESSITAGSGAGRQSNSRVRRSRFSKQASGTAEVYETRLSEMIKNTITGNLDRIHQKRFYDAMENAGLAVMERPGETVDVPPGFNSVPIETKLKVREGVTRVYIRNDLYREMRNLANIDSPLRAKISRAANWMAIHSLVEPAFHLANQLTGVTRDVRGGNLVSTLAQKYPGVNIVSGLGRVLFKIRDVLGDSPEIRRQIANLAREGAISADRPGWMGKVIHLTDTAARLVRDDIFDQLVKSGMVEDTPRLRREWVNQLGQYNGRLTGAFQRMLKDFGASPFVVAGRNFNRLGVRAVTASPGIETKTPGAALQLRAEHIAGIVMAGATAAILNKLSTGSVFGRDGVPIGAIDTGGKDENGDPRYFDPLKFSGVRRGLRVTGAGAVAEGLRYGRPAGMIADDWARQVVGAATHPWTGPTVQAASTLARGEDVMGYPTAPKAAPGDSQAFQNALSALAQLNPSIGAAIEGYRTKGVRGAMAEPFKSLEPSVGIGEGKPPRDQARMKAQKSEYKRDQKRRARQ